MVGAAGRRNTQRSPVETGDHPFGDVVPPRHCDQMGVAGEMVIGNPTTYRVPPTWVLGPLIALGLVSVSVAVRDMIPPR